LAVLVPAIIDPGADALVEEIAVGGVELDPMVPGLLSQLSRIDEILDDPGDFFRAIGLGCIPEIDRGALAQSSYWGT
jgi:hypothetical protein